MTKPDIAFIETIITEVAAAEIMPRYRKLAATDVEMKGINDPVTVADKAAEIALAARLQDYIPGSLVVGEEGVAADKTTLSRLSSKGTLWVIDPIDGTRNFISGSPEFGTMVALIHDQQTIGAWIHDPNTGDTLTAEQGSGVWLRGQKMLLAGHDKTISTVMLVGARLNRLLKNPEHAEHKQRLPPFEAGSASAFDYGRLFTGLQSFALSSKCRAAYILNRQTKPWDHLAGLFLLAESGGYAATLHGKPYDMRTAKDGILIAPSPEHWHDMFDAVRPVMDDFLELSA